MVHETTNSISEQSVLVVGGTSGIGKAAALAFLAAGAHRIVLVGRDYHRGVAARDQLRSHSTARIEFVAADVRTAAEAQRVVDEAIGHLQRIDVLINTTAASHLPTLLHECPIDGLSATLTDIAMPALLMTCAALPGMRAHNGGCIINVASDAAKVPTPGESVIGAAMAAIVTFSRTVAMEAKRDGIRVNVLTPSLVDGTGTAQRLFADDFSARLFGKASQLAHLGVSTAEDQAALMVYLAGPHGQRITGQVISVNGGISSA